MVKRLPFKVAVFICLFKFEWHSQNEVGNIGILVLWRDREKPMDGSFKLIKKSVFAVYPNGL